MTLPGVGRDAAYVAKRIAARSGAGRKSCRRLNAACMLAERGI